MCQYFNVTVTEVKGTRHVICQDTRNYSNFVFVLSIFLLLVRFHQAHPRGVRQPCSLRLTPWFIIMVFFFTRHFSSSFSITVSSSPVVYIRGPFNSFAYGSFSTRISISIYATHEDRIQRMKCIRVRFLKEGHLSTGDDDDACPLKYCCCTYVLYIRTGQRAMFWRHHTLVLHDPSCVYDALFIEMNSRGIRNNICQQ